MSQYAQETLNMSSELCNTILSGLAENQVT